MSRQGKSEEKFTDIIKNFFGLRSSSTVTPPRSLVKEVVFTPNILQVRFQPPENYIHAHTQKKERKKKKQTYTLIAPLFLFLSLPLFLHLLSMWNQPSLAPLCGRLTCHLLFLQLIVDLSSPPLFLIVVFSHTFSLSFSLSCVPHISQMHTKPGLCFFYFYK